MKGEFLTDFSVFDGNYCYKIACESEWGRRKSIKSAFEKLVFVKAELKSLIFQSKFSEEASNERRLPEKVWKDLQEPLQCKSTQVDGREAYLIIQYDGEDHRVFLDPGQQH